MEKFFIIFLYGLFYVGSIFSQQSGEDGAINWKIADSTLIITGNGPMPVYNDDNPRPWHNQRDLFTSIVIGEGVTSICNGAFHSYYHITSVQLPSTLTTIGNNAFVFCYGLTSITIPASVTFIGGGALTGGALTSITVEEANQNYSSEDGVLYNKDKTTLLLFPPGREGSFIIPEKVDTITNGAFEFCFKLTSVTIPKSVLTIGHNAFYRSGISSLSISASVTFIGDCAVGGCSNMTSISVDAANPVFSSKDGVLFNKNMTKVVAFPSGRWGDYTIPESVDTIGISAFWESKLSSVTISSSVKRIGTMAFRLNGNLKSITIPSTVKSIGFGAFLDSGLTSVIISSQETEIEGAAFNGCGNISEVVNYSITPQLLPPNGYFSVFPNAIFSSCILRVPAASIESYRKAEVWKEFVNIKAIEEKLTLDIKTMYLLNGATTEIKATVADELKSSETVWNSDHPEVATVDNTGKVKGISTGSTVITASVGMYEARCEVTVIESGNSTIEGTITNTGTANIRVNLYINTEEPGYTKKGILGGYVLLATTVPNDNGDYSFDNLPVGSYQVQVVLEGYDPEATEAISLSGDETLKDINFIVGDDIICACPDQDPDLHTGTVETWHAASLQFYPNPFTDAVRITGAIAETLRTTSLRIQVINVAGEIVHTHSIASPDDPIHLGHLPAGMYIIRLENGGWVKTFKAVKIQ